jgi:uncharacterized protein (TIGR03086 family)
MRAVQTTVDVRELYTRCSAEFGERVHAVAGRWDAPTPLPGWDVRTLVRHIVEEELWAPPLLAGRTIEEVGDRFSGDLLGADPVRAGDEAAAAAVEAVRAAGALERTVHLSFGDHPAREYAVQLAADHQVHAVDLARALGTDDTVDPAAAAAVRERLAGMEDSYREMGVIGPRVDVPAGAGAQAELLGMMGRTP